MALGDGPLPKSNFPDPKPRHPSRPATPRPSDTDLFTQTTETGRPIPIVIGTAKLSPNVIERVAPQPITSAIAAWTANTVMNRQGEFRTNGGKVYTVIRLGTTAASGGPTGTGYDITDNTVRWAYVSPAPAEWQPSTAYVVGQVSWRYLTERLNQEDNFTHSVLRAYVCITAGTSGAGPTGTGADITDGTAHWAHVDGQHRQLLTLGLCEGPISGVLRAWQDRKTLLAYTDLKHTGPNLTLLTGGASQARPSWAVGLAFTETYNHTAILFIDQGNNDDSAPDVALEVQGFLSAAVDASPVDAALILLCADGSARNNRCGAAWARTKVQSDAALTAATGWKTYCTAAQIALSWVIDSQRSALDLLMDLLTATNTDAVWSEGQLRFIPRSDQAIGSYVPNTTPLFDLGPDDYLAPLEIERRRPADCFNSVPIEYTRRADTNGQAVYTRDIVDNPDMADIDRRGLVKAPAMSLPFILSPPIAAMLSRIYCQRSLGLRNTYTARLPWRYMRLEPGDIVTLSDSRIRDDGSTDVLLDKVPVKIQSWEETINEDGSSEITITCEDYPAAAHHAAQYTPQAGDGYRPVGETAVNGILAQPTAGPGVNLLYNSDFSAGTPTTFGATTGGWTLGVSAVWPNAWAGLARDHSGASWTLAGDTDPKNLHHNNTFELYQANRNADGSYAELSSARMSVDPAKRYAFSVYAGMGSQGWSTILLYLAWFKADGSASAIKAYTYAPTPDAQLSGQATGGQALAGYRRIFVVDAPPSDAASCACYVRKMDTLAGFSTSYMFLCRAQFEEVPPGALVPGPWVPSAQNIVPNAGLERSLARIEVTNSNTDAFVAITFKDAVGNTVYEPGTEYMVQLTPKTFTGSPPQAAFIVKNLTKQQFDCFANFNAAPGAGASITWDVEVSNLRVTDHLVVSP